MVSCSILATLSLPSTHIHGKSNPANLCRRCCDSNCPSTATKDDPNISIGEHALPKPVASLLPVKGDRTEILTEEEIGFLLSMVMLMCTLVYPPI